MQDCLAAAWQRMETFDVRSSLGTWSQGIMKFKVIDHFRKSKRMPTNQALLVADEDEADQDPMDNLFNSKGVWKVAPITGWKCWRTHRMTLPLANAAPMSIPIRCACTSADAGIPASRHCAASLIILRMSWAFPKSTRMSSASKRRSGAGTPRTF